jgi:hypothetical protein
MSKTSWALVSQYAQALSLPIQCTLGSMAGGILVKSIDCRDVILKATFDGRGTGYPIRFGDCVVENETALNKYLIEIFSGHSIETLESLQETMATWGASRIKEAAAASPDLLRGNGVDNPHLPADYRQRLEAAANSRKDVLTLPRSLDPWELLGTLGIRKEEVTPDTVILLTYPGGDKSLSDRVTEAAVQVSAMVDRPVIMMPSPCEFQTMPLAEVTKLRDRMNEIIYDKERAG